MDKKKRRHQLTPSRNGLKLLAALAMLGDHYASMFIRERELAYHVLRFFGRMTAPIMCFFLVEGFLYTRDRRAYGRRMLVFGLISQPVFAYAMAHKFWEEPYDMILTLFLSFLCLVVIEGNYSRSNKEIMIFFLLAATCFCDWALFGPLWVLGFYWYRKDQKKKTLMFVAVALLMLVLDALTMVQEGKSIWMRAYEIGVFLPLPLLLRYDPNKESRKVIYGGRNGNAGKRKGSWFIRVYQVGSKWFFYVFYPLHLFILAGFRRGLFGGL